MRLSVILAVLILAGCAAPADDAAKDTYSQNLATAKAAVQAHINADYDAWMECHSDNAVIWDAGYGTTRMTPQEAATAFAGHHDAFDGISTTRSYAFSTVYGDILIFIETPLESSNPFPNAFHERWDAIRAEQ